MQPDLVECSQFSFLTIILQDFLSVPNTLACVIDITYPKTVSNYPHTSAKTYWISYIQKIFLVVEYY